MIILAVDPGEKNLGVAVCDALGIAARPLLAFKHTNRTADAQCIAALARDHQADLIVVGWTLDDDHQPTPQGRRAARLAEAIRAHTAVPVAMHDEAGTTRAARAIMLANGKSRRARRSDDAQAAAVLLQSYLDDHPEPPTPPPGT